MNHPARHSRYHIVSSPPPALQAVLKSLESEARRYGCFRDTKSLRGTMASANLEYRVKGRADDLSRFLQNHNVLLKEKDTGLIYFDPERAATVITAYEAGRMPGEPVTPAEVRVTVLKALQSAPPTPEEPALPSGVVETPSLSVELDGLLDEVQVRALGDDALTEYGAELEQAMSHLRSVHGFVTVEMDRRAKIQEERRQKREQILAEKKKLLEAARQKDEELALIDAELASPF